MKAPIKSTTTRPAMRSILGAPAAEAERELLLRGVRYPAALEEGGQHGLLELQPLALRGVLADGDRAAGYHAVAPGPVLAAEEALEELARVLVLAVRAQGDVQAPGEAPGDDGPHHLL